MPYDITDALQDIQVLAQELEALKKVLVDKGILEKPKKE